MAVLSVGIDGRGARTGANDVVRSLDDIRKSARQTTDVLDAQGISVKSLGSNLGGLARSMAGIAGLAVGVGQAFSFIKESVLLSARIETLGVVMRKIGNVSGYTSKEVMAVADSVRKMGITTEEAYGTVTQMIQAELDLTKAAQLARVAQDAAVIAGTDSSQALGAMIHGIVTMQPEMLRMYGIILDLNVELAKYAAEHKVNQQAISATEKQQIFMNATLEQGRKIMGSYEAAMGTAGKQLTSMPRYIADVKEKFGNMFLPAFNMALFSVVDGLKLARTNLVDLEKSAAFRSIQMTIMRTVDAIGHLVKAVVGMGAAWAVLTYGQKIIAFFQTLNLQMGLLRLEMGASATTAQIAGAMYRQMGISAQIAAGAITKLGVAINMAFAFIGGWQIGSWLRDNFKWAEDAGAKFVSFVYKGFTILKYTAMDLAVILSNLWDLDAMQAGLERNQREFDRRIAEIDGTIKSMLKDNELKFDTTKANEAVDVLGEKIAKIGTELIRQTNEWNKQSKQAARGEETPLQKIRSDKEERFETSIKPQIYELGGAIRQGRNVDELRKAINDAITASENLAVAQERAYGTSMARKIREVTAEIKISAMETANSARSALDSAIRSGGLMGEQEMMDRQSAREISAYEAKINRQKQLSRDMRREADERKRADGEAARLTIEMEGKKAEHVQKTANLRAKTEEDAIQRVLEAEKDANSTIQKISDARVEAGLMTEKDAFLAKTRMRQDEIAREIGLLELQQFRTGDSEKAAEIQAKINKLLNEQRGIIETTPLQTAKIDTTSYKRNIEQQVAAAQLEIEKIAGRESSFEITKSDASRERLVWLVKQRDAHKSLLDEMARGPLITNDQITAYNSQASALEQVNQRIIEQQRLLQDRTPMGGLMKSLYEYSDAALNLGEQISNAVTNVMKGMEDALVSFVQKGKVDFRSLADSIISDLIRIFIRAQITGPLAAGFAGMFSPASGQTGIWSAGGPSPAKMIPGSPGAVAFHGMAFDSFSNVIPFRRGGVVEHRTLFSFASGTGEMSEAGRPEAIMPLSRLPGGDLGVKASGTSTPKVTVNVINKSSEKLTVTKERTRFDSQGMIVDLMIDAVRRNVNGAGTFFGR